MRSAGVCFAYYRSFDEADADDDVHAVIITGAGEFLLAGFIEGDSTWEDYEEALEGKGRGRRGQLSSTF